MAKKSYSEVVEENTQALKEFSAIAASSPGAIAALSQEVKGLTNVVTGLNVTVMRMDETVRATSITQATLITWRDGHKDTHDVQDKQIDKAVGRSTLALRLEALTTFLTGVFGISRIGTGGSS